MSETFNQIKNNILKLIIYFLFGSNLLPSDTLSAHQTYYCVNRQNNTNSRNHIKKVWPQKESLGGVLRKDNNKNNIISVSIDNGINQRNASIYTNDTTSHESGGSAASAG